MGAYGVEEFTELGALRSISAAWEAFCARLPDPPVSAHPENLLLWMRTIGRGTELRAAAVWFGEALVGFAPFMENRQRIGPVSRPAIRFIGNNVGFPGDNLYMDVWSVDRDPAIVRMLLAHAKSRWKAAVWDFGYLPPDSPALPLVRNLLGIKERDTRFLPPQTYPSLRLPSTWDAYLANLSAESRQHYRRYTRRLEELGKVEVRAFRDPEGCERVVREIIRNHERWWTGTEKESWFGDAITKGYLLESAKLLAAMNKYLAFSLELDGRPIAWHSGPLSRTVYHSNLLGYDQAYARQSPGSTLSFALIRDLVDSGIRRFELGPGFDQRKQALGGIPIKHARIMGYFGVWRDLSRLRRWLLGRKTAPREQLQEPTEPQAD